MRLTDNKIEYDGCILYQVARYNRVKNTEEFGGFIEKHLFYKLSNKSWIGINSYVYRCIMLRGNIIVGKNTIINDSILNGDFLIKNHVIISGCNIKTRKYACVIDSKSSIYNKTFIATGRYEAKLFDDEYFNYKSYKNIDLITTKHYCRVLCMTMTYTEAWKYLHDETIWEQLRLKNQSTSPPQLFTPELKLWLLDECEIGLNKLRQG